MSDDRPLRVLLISNFFPPYWVGGYEQIASWVANGLRERGHEVIVLTGRGDAFADDSAVVGELDLDLAAMRDAYFASGTAHLDRFPVRLRRWVFSRPNYRACRRLIDRFRPDLISFWNPTLISFSPLLAARRAGVPAVVHLSDATVNVFRSRYPPRMPRGTRGLVRWFVDRLFRATKPARIVVPSNFLRDHFLEHERLPAGAEVLHWPVEPTISERPAPQRTPTSTPRFLFVGNLIEEKGTHVLLDAFRQVSDRYPDVRLTLVGEGCDEYVDGLREAARNSPVTFAGRLDRAEVVAAYEQHDVLLFPSVWNEPFAAVPLEGLAMGLTVIASTAGGTPEAVRHEETGLLVPANDVAALRDAMLRIIDDPEWARSLAAAGEVWARRTLSFPAFLDRLVTVYRGVRPR